MAEVSDEDRKMALEACRNWARDGALIHGEVAKQIADARDEGRREERDRCSAIADIIREQAAKRCCSDCAAAILHEIRNG